MSLTERNVAKDDLSLKVDRALREAVSEVYADLESTGDSSPYLIDEKVVWLTIEQHRALEARKLAEGQSGSSNKIKER